MTRVVFAGAYGIRSQGDDAALLALVAGLRERLGDFDGVVVARHAAEDHYAPYGLRSVQNLEYDRKTDSTGRWFRGFNFGDDRSHLETLQAELDGADLLVLGAGNFLVDVTIDLLRGPIPYLTVLALMARMARIPVMWFGMSVGPFRTAYGRRLSALAADLVDMVTVRDHRSLAELQALGLHRPAVRLPDPVLGLEPPPAAVSQGLASWREAHGRGAPVVAVSVRALPAGSPLDTGTYVRGMAAACDVLAGRGAALLFVPQCTYRHGHADEDDRVVARRVREAMGRGDRAVLVEEDLTVAECLAAYRGARAALCTRLHACVYAAIQGVAPVAVSYNPKVAAFMEWLDLPDLSVGLEDFDPAGLDARVETVMARGPDLSRQVLDRVAQGRAGVQAYADLACRLMAGTGGEG